MSQHSATVTSIVGGRVNLRLSNKRNVSIPIANAPEGVQATDVGMFDDGRHDGLKFRSEGTLTVEGKA